jgi:thiol-disulfide isomerase/thioredoxin
MALIFMVGFAGTIAAYRWVLRPAKPSAGQENTHPLYGKKAPEIHGITLDGKPFDLTWPTDKPILLIFWASWCLHCKIDVPVVMKARRSELVPQFSPTRVQIVGVMFRDLDDDRARAEAERQGLLSVRYGGDVGRDFGINGVPSYLLVDQDGFAVYTRVGRGLISSSLFRGTVSARGAAFRQSRAQREAHRIK